MLINAIIYRWLVTLFNVVNPTVSHQWIINNSLMQETEDFNRMFGYIGPSGTERIRKYWSLIG